MGKEFEKLFHSSCVRVSGINFYNSPMISDLEEVSL